MAKLTKTVTEKEVVVTKKVKVPVFTLELSLDEAIVVRSLLGSCEISGDSRNIVHHLFHQMETVPSNMFNNYCPRQINSLQSKVEQYEKANS